MKNPSPVQTVFKVVQLSPRGRMWSVNPNPRCFIDKMLLQSDRNREQLVHYRMLSQVKPLGGGNIQALFACPSLTDAKKAKVFYTRCEKPVKILRCLAYNVREVTRATIDADPALQQWFKNGVNACRGSIYLPSYFRTVLCDWLIPLSSVD